MRFLHFAAAKLQLFWDIRKFYLHIWKKNSNFVPDFGNAVLIDEISREGNRCESCTGPLL